MTDTISTTFTGESLSYEILWSCCKRQQALADENDSGSLYFKLTAMCMAYFTFEAYLNYALHKVVPDIYEQERSYFRGEEYPGTTGKLKKLCELADVDFPDTSKRPYQSIKILQKFRDSVAHAKADPFEVKIQHKPDEYPSAIPSTYEKFLVDPGVSRCISDLEELIVDLNGKLREKFPHSGILSHPLKGFLGHSASSMM